MRIKFLIGLGITFLWVLLLPIWIGWTNFFGILATLILFYPLFIPSLCGAFLFTFFYQKRHTSKEAIFSSIWISISLTLLMFFIMRSFLEPGLFSLGGSEFYFMGFIYFVCSMATASFGIFIRLLINNK